MHVEEWRACSLPVASYDSKTNETAGKIHEVDDISSWFNKYAIRFNFLLDTSSYNTGFVVLPLKSSEKVITALIGKPVDPSQVKYRSKKICLEYSPDPQQRMKRKCSGVCLG